MDTRTKILPPALAAQRIAAESLPVVQLDCDPLLASVISKLPNPCVIFVADRPESYLSTDARAELAASLKAARFVSIGEHPGALDFRPAEQAARRALEQLVVTKSKGA